jgi:hypothetical protein
MPANRRAPGLAGIAIALISLFWAATAVAEAGTLRLGGMELTYDAARWRAEPVGDNAVTMRPIGEVARKLDPVVVDRRPISGGCGQLARNELAAGPYEGAEQSATELAGRPAIRLTAHTRCRNAMPRGVVICVEHRGTAYLLSATRPGCRSGAVNLFSGVDPQMELAAGVRFLP